MPAPDAAAKLVVANIGKSDHGAADGRDHKVAGGDSKGAFAGTRAAQFGRVDAGEANPGFNLLAEPDAGANRNRVAIDHGDHARGHGTGNRVGGAGPNLVGGDNGR